MPHKQIHTFALKIMSMRINQTILMTAALGVTTLFSGKAWATKEEKPNLLYIFPDQYRLHALSLWNSAEYKAALSTLGDPVHTPNLDKLAKQGVVFTQACSTHPLSSPHRAMLLSGMYPNRNGIENINCKQGRKQELRHDIVCLTDVLAQSGYETAYIGKTHWHKTEAVFDEKGTYVGTTEAPGGHSIGLFDTYIPEGKSRHGNKFWFQQLNDNHFNPIAYSNQPELIGGKKDGEQYRPREFSVKKEADIVIRYLENKNNERDPGKPFSILWSINPPHPPYFQISDCDSTIFNRYYKDMHVQDLLVRPNVDYSAKAGDHTATTEQRLDINARIYFSLIKSIDEEVGRVLKVLEKTGEANNTLIIFTSDHGEMMGSHKLTGKNSIYDESFLVPFIMHYPNKMKHRLENLMLGSVDIMPTTLGLLGLGEKIPETVMGVDYSKGLLTGNFSSKDKPLSALFLRSDMKGVRSDQYTYAVDKSGNYQLFDNRKDPYQTKQIHLEQISPKDARMLKTELGSWLKTACDGWYDTRKNKELIIYP